MTNYVIENIYNQAVAWGAAPEERVKAAAQEFADKLHAPVWVTTINADESRNKPVRVEPSPDPAVVKRQRMERSIVRRVVKDALAAGYALGVDTGGDELDVKAATKAAQVLPVLFDVDEAFLILTHPGDGKPRGGWVRFVFGNDGWDVIADYTDTLDPLLKGALELADRLEERAAR